MTLTNSQMLSTAPEGQGGTIHLMGTRAVSLTNGTITYSADG